MVHIVVPGRLTDWGNWIVLPLRQHILPPLAKLKNSHFWLWEWQWICTSDVHARYQLHAWFIRVCRPCLQVLCLILYIYLYYHSNRPKLLCIIMLNRQRKLETFSLKALEFNVLIYCFVFIFTWSDRRRCRTSCLLLATYSIRNPPPSPLPH